MAVQNDFGFVQIVLDRTKKHIFTPEFYILNQFQTFIPVQNNLEVSKIIWT